jgi:hypothetical protein
MKRHFYPQGLRHGWMQFGCLLTLVMACSFPSLGQQVTARLIGTVRDTSDALIPEAALRATNVSTGVVTTTVSDSNGNYEFAQLAPGMYTLSIEKPGFAATVISGISLSVDQKATMDVVLKVGQVTQSVEVQGAAPLVETTSASLGTVVLEKPILDLPLNLRRIGGLALVVPRTVDTTGRSLTSANGNGSGFNENSYSAAGGRSTGNLILIDGMVSRALNNGGFSLQPIPEMVKEFNIENNNYNAAFGLASGSTMNVITESGTNALHGSAWEFLRNRDLDARNFFAVNQVNPFTGQETPGSARPEFIRNQFGFALGGPIRRNKTFFFGSYEGLRLVQGQTGTSVVPTAPEKAGDFSSFLTGQTMNLCGTGGPASLNFDTGQLFYPATESLFTCPSGSTILIGAPITGNVITNMDPVAQKILALFPAPNRPGSPNFVNQTPLRRQDEQFDARIDEVLSNKDRLFGRYLFGNTNQRFPGAFPLFNSFQHFRGQNAVVGWTHIFSPSLINDVRVGYQRDFLDLDCQGCPRQPGLLASFGIQNLKASTPQLEEYPFFGFVNFAGVGDGGYLPDILPDNIEKYEDTFTKIAGRHTIVVGGDFNFWQTVGVEDPKQVNGDLTFNGQYASLASEIPGVSAVSDLADLELGFPSSGFYTKSPIINELVGGGWFNVFAQDNIRINPRLSVEVGLRWEYRKQPHDKHNLIAALYPLAYNSKPGDALLLTPLPAAANDALCSNPFFLNTNGQCVIMSSAMRTQLGLNVRELSTGPGHGDFAPRLGVSWRPTSSDKLIVHAGAGVFHDLPLTNIQGSYVNNNPVFTQTPVFSPAFGAPPALTNGAPTTSETLFANAATTPLSQILGELFPSPFYHTPTVYEWSATVQSQVTQNWALEVGYAGNHGAHMDRIHLFGNQARPGIGDLQPRRPWPDFNIQLFDEFTGVSSYNSFSAKATKRFSSGFQALISYTFAKVLDYNGGDSDFVALLQDDNNPRADYGLSDLSIRQRLVLTPIWQLPFGKGQRFLNNGRLVNALAGGWELSGIISVQSGYPFSVLANQDFSNTGSLSPRPDRICNGAGPKTVAEWFNTSCFTTAALSQALANGAPRFGNSGKNILFGPGLQDWDVSAIKRTSLTERLNLEFRAEFFNLFNHANFGTPGQTIDSSTAGLITGAGSPRDIQFGLKLAF